MEEIETKIQDVKDTLFQELKLREIRPEKRLKIKGFWGSGKSLALIIGRYHNSQERRGCIF